MMMEDLDIWNLGLLFNCFVFCVFLVIQSISAQDGFLSVKCCADSNFTDPHTGISWITDEDWYPDKQSCQELKGAVQNDRDYDKARFFNSQIGGKWCYNLKTAAGEDYLIRGSFPRGDLGSSFGVLVGVTPIGQVKSPDDYTVEGIFTAANDFVNFCLLRQKEEPYISKLELRIVSSDYVRSQPSTVLKLVDRVDVGNTGAAIRYPQDPYDRIWRPVLDAQGNATITSLKATNIIVNNSIIQLPPKQVLQTALVHPERLEFLHRDLDTGDHNYRLFLYFVELIDSIEPGQRVFDIYINNERRQEVDIVAGGSRYDAVFLNFMANGLLNLTLAKASNNSHLGPICNAYEILQVHQWIQETAQGDVDVIMQVRKELLMGNQNNVVLESWSGDPCLPSPWQGLFCEPYNGSSVITKMNLASSNFQGSLPPSVTKLTHLTELNMSSNCFTGTIPAFPDSLLLTIVDLSHNDLTGNIPQSLASLPYLQVLYFGCNPQFSNKPQANLNRSRLITDNGMCDDQEMSHSTRTIVISTVAGGSLFVTFAVTLLFVCFRKQRLKPEGKFGAKGHTTTKNAIYSMPSTEDIVFKSISIQSFTLACIEAVTENYKTLIGEGGFGSVYRGTLPDGQEVAVKVRSATSTQGTREFDNELNFLSAIQHENLVPLLGYCCENDQQILVYPFMSNGSLQDRLYGEAAKRKILDWPTRLSIALGSARGLTYLHTFPGRSVIHRDVKSSNILLDHSMCAKVADFGFSKYAPQEGDSGASLEVRGTAGYLDPEYYSTQHLSAKSDVFSFGVVLLEIISGREPLNIHRPRNEWSLVEWAKPYIRSSRIEEIVDPSIKGGYHAEAMWRVVEVSLACIEPFSAYRPCMADIVRELEDALIIETNASEYMKSLDSFGGSNRFSTERPMVILPAPTPTPTGPSPILCQPAPPQPR